MTLNALTCLELQLSVRPRRAFGHLLVMSRPSFSEIGDGLRASPNEALSPSGGFDDVPGFVGQRHVDQDVSGEELPRREFSCDPLRARRPFRRHENVSELSCAESSDAFFQAAFALCSYPEYV
jgi:hypothetical protein